MATLADPDLQISGEGGGGGGRATTTGYKGGGRSPKNIFSVWSENKGGRRVPGAPSLDPPLHFENDENRPVAPTRLGRL